MAETEVWTVDGTEATDQEGECYFIVDAWLHATEFAGRVPLDVVAALLRAAGYQVLSPKAQSELGV